MSEARQDPEASRLEGEAREVAILHTIAKGPPRALSVLAAGGRLEGWFDQAARAVREQRIEQKVAEWLLDNSHQIRRVARQMPRDMPPPFYRRLPATGTGPARGLPRVYLLARSLVTASRFQLDLDVLVRFVVDYQQVAPLRIAELWALPTMLRAVCIETICEVAAPVLSLAPPFRSELPAPLADLADAERIGCAIRGLTAIGAVPWPRFVERTSLVERALAMDPAAAYTLCDDKTRDRYRRSVEELALHSGCEEVTVAEEAVLHARRFAATQQVGSPADANDPPLAEPARPANHVGHWLVGGGRGEFERSLGIRLPLRTRVRRAARRHALALYLGSVAAATAVVLAVPAFVLAAADSPPWLVPIGLLVCLLPAWTVATALVQWGVCHLVAPSVLPKLDFDQGIPTRWRTAVVVPCLLSDSDEVGRLLDALERHFLSNSDPALVFALLSDFVDAPSETQPADAALLDLAVRGIRELNARHPAAGFDRFHLLHRPRVYSDGERCWMGWERKRGKLEEWNEYLVGGSATSFLHEGSDASLRGIRFVVTVDSDTVLPPGAVARLAGVLAHPLNRPRFAHGGDELTSGYTVVQPRVEISPEAAERSMFARICAGDASIDLYSRAVSDVYQDLFSTGLYVGKGIYDVAAFRRTLVGRVPANALASHDLFEGIHGRVALATDVVVYEDFPAHYLAYARRMHRWVRGDWQLLPWVGRTVPSRDGTRVRTRLGTLGRLFILDNLRRSLLSPSLLAMAVVGWVALPGPAVLWTALVLAAPTVHSLLDLIAEATRDRGLPSTSRTTTLWQNAAMQGRRVALLMALLPYETVLGMDAVARALVRMTITRRHLLEWQTASMVAASLDGAASPVSVWRQMAVGPVLAASCAAGLAIVRPEALPAALVLLVPWFVSPGVAVAVSRPRPWRHEEIRKDQRVFLRRLARRTWLFFETFIGPDSHWLPPDNYQEVPTGTVDHRTSPTNIGMLLLSTTSAWDLGYIGVRELAVRLGDTMQGIEGLERFRGHLFNWYDTRTRRKLPPAYVSTVDSGNLATSLIAVSGACREATGTPVLSTRRWDGLMDALAWLEDALARLLPATGRSTDSSLAARVASIRRQAARARDEPANWSRMITRICERDCADLDRLLMETIQSHQGLLGYPALHEVRIWLDRVHRHLRSMHNDLDALLGWLPRPEADSSTDQAGLAGGLEAAVAAQLPPETALTDIPDGCVRVRKWLAASGHATDPDAVRLDAALARAQAAATSLVDRLLALAVDCEAEALAPEFGFLYDADRDLFHTGYNVGSGALDPHYYDLLASECRLASYFAIAKGEVPPRHWLHLGRPMTRTAGSLALLSWGGTMFEYLMPRLLLRGGSDDLVSRSERAVVDTHRAFGRSHRIPWGISESGFASVDAAHVYQYQAFGVPGLGLRRELGSDLVVAPYAGVLALPVRPAASVENLLELRELGAMGEFGFREALDFTPVRLLEGRRFEIVRSYMAHHQGMILAALDNFLSDSAHVRRFHAHALMRTADFLLRERVPAGGPLEFPARAAAVPAPRRAGELRTLYSWRPARLGPVPELHAIGNGRLSTVFSESGSGGLRWMGRALTHWVGDPVLDDTGVWLYVRDLEDGALWSVGRQPVGSGHDEYEVVFHPHMVELHHRALGIAIRLEVFVAPGDDVEIRRLTIVNGSSRRRRLAIASYAEIVLAPSAEHLQHPAFSRLFVRAKVVPELDAVLLERRPRKEGEKPPVLLHRLLCGSPNVRRSRVEVSRERFLGRLGDPRRPSRHEGPPGDEEATDLDPIASIEATVELREGGTERLAFTTTVGGSRRDCLAVAERYGRMGALDWVLTDAGVECAREAARLDVDPAALPLFQRLLSLVLQRSDALRGPAATIAANRLSQDGLWRMGISGDLPMVLVVLDDPGDTVLLAQMLRAHALWARRGIQVDVVVLYTHPTGYEDEVARTLHSLVEGLGQPASLGRPAGVHLVRADRSSPEDVTLLKVAARVVLAGGLPLDGQLDGVRPAARHAPPFVVADPPPSTPAPVPESREALLYDNGTGGFSADGTAYVIRLEPGRTTPAPWCNVLANDVFGTLVTESGGGYTWSVNAGQRRLSQWRNDPLCDAPSESLYVRDEETAVVWMPMAPSPTAWVEVCHETKRSLWTRNDHGLEQKVEVRIAEEEPVKIVRLTLADLTGRPRRLTVTYFVEWVLGSSREPGVALLVPEYDAHTGALLARNPWNPALAERVAFLVSSEAPHGFTTDRDEFFGREGDRRSPAALGRWGLDNVARPGSDPCAVLQIHVEIPANSTACVHFALGDGSDRTEAIRLAERWRASSTVDQVSRSRREHARGSLVVRTPEPSLDNLVNHWLLRQALSARIQGRTGYFQSSGAFGFRDQLQDVLAFLLVEPSRARQHILECASRQFREGDVLHWWHPPDGRGVRTRCSDDLLWLPYATACYVEATGDVAILDEGVPFLTGPVLAPTETDRYAKFESEAHETPLMEHCVRALERGVTRGPNGLPLIGAGDWNDGMNHIGRLGRGESVWLAWFAVATIEAFVRVCDLRAERDLAAAWRRRAAELASAAEEAGWDGQWYRRAFDDEGRPWGSAKGQECRIDSIAQSWAVLGGQCDAQRGREALESAWRELVREEDGVARLLWPPFDHTARDPGYIKAYPPGVRENGGQYSHAAAWLALAFARVGDGDRALRILRLINPVEHCRDEAGVARYRVEPYVVAGDVLSVAPYIGRGGWTWYTGAAAWTWRAVVEGLLGLRLRRGALEVDPCLPPDWSGFEATLDCPDGGRVEIHVERVDAETTDRCELLVDGVAVPDGRLPLPPRGETARVHARVGRPRGRRPASRGLRVGAPLRGV